MPQDPAPKFDAVKWFRRFVTEQRTYRAYVCFAQQDTIFQQLVNVLVDFILLLLHLVDKRFSFRGISLCRSLSSGFYLDVGLQWPLRIEESRRSHRTQRTACIQLPCEEMRLSP